MNLREKEQTALQLGLTAILLGYFLAWAPPAAAGLRLPGFEMGEWVKFLPQVQLGETPNRNWFYAPPLLLGVLLVLYSAYWPDRRLQTWALRLLAGAVSLLALPALQIIRLEPAAQWRLRVVLIGLVIALAFTAPLFKRLPPTALSWAAVGVALLGAAAPTWAYLGVRPAIAFWLATPVGIGPGVILNLIGFLLVAGSVLAGTRRQ